MKKTIITAALTSLMLNAFVTTFTIANQFNTKASIPSINEDIDKYVQQTSEIPKSLLVSSQHNLTTNQLLSDMNNANPNRATYSIPSSSGQANEFIQNLTKNLDYQSTANIEAQFVANGTKQSQVEQIKNDITSEKNLTTYIQQKTILSYVNNKKLADPTMQQTIESVLLSAKKYYPNQINYLQYLPVVKTLIEELTTDWDQSSQWGDTPKKAMEAYIHSEKGDIAQAKTVGTDEWHYVDSRADNWTWNDFYQYMAGVNFNYMFKVLTKGVAGFSANGEYIGDMITNNLSIANFQKDKFEAQIGEALGRLSSTPAAWPYLIKAVVPILKANPNFLNFGENQTKAITSLSWNNVIGNKTGASLQQLLTEITTLLKPNNQTALTNLITPLLSGDSKFTEDIILHHSIFGYYTLPEALKTFSIIVTSLKPEELAGELANFITQAANKPSSGTTIEQKLQNILDIANQDVVGNPVINLVDFKTNFDKIFNSDFDQAFTMALDIINNSMSSKYTASEVLAKLGVNSDSKAIDFVQNSPLANLVQWITDSKSSFNQILGVATNGNDGVIDTLLNRNETEYNNLYEQYFDINNQTHFKISNQQLVPGTINGRIFYSLSYDLIDNDTKLNYHVSFSTYDLTKPFLMNSFFQIQKSSKSS